MDRDAVGGAVGDRIKVWREERPAWQKLNQRETLRAATEDLRRRGIDEPSPDTKPEHLVEILEAAAERTAPEIRELFARLLTAAMDPMPLRRSDRRLRGKEAAICRYARSRAFRGAPWKPREPRL